VPRKYVEWPATRTRGEVPLLVRTKNPPDLPRMPRAQLPSDP